MKTQKSGENIPIEILLELKQEEEKQRKRVKRIFPEKKGVVKKRFLTSKIKPKEVDRIKLALLMERLFMGREYKIEIDPNVHWIESPVREEGYIESSGPKIAFYLEKDGILRGVLTAEMPKLNNIIYGINARLKKVGSEFMYLIGPESLVKIDVLTEEKTPYDKKALNTQKVLHYLAGKNELNLS